jgi:hypothetical protein
MGLNHPPLCWGLADPVEYGGNGAVLGFCSLLQRTLGHRVSVVASHPAQANAAVNGPSNEGRTRSCQHGAGLWTPIEGRIGSWHHSAAPVTSNRGQTGSWQHSVAPVTPDRGQTGR